MNESSRWKFSADRFRESPSRLMCLGRRKNATGVYYDVLWTGDRDEDPGDLAILKEAFLDERVLVTLDKDFGDLAILWSVPHRGILRLVNIPARQQGLFINHVLSVHGAEFMLGAIATVESNRIRIRPPDAP